LLALAGAHHFVDLSRIRVKTYLYEAKKGELRLATMTTAGSIESLQTKKR
jgi:hypothetical protein